MSLLDNSNLTLIFAPSSLKRSLTIVLTSLPFPVLPWQFQYLTGLQLEEEEEEDLEEDLVALSGV